MDDLRQRAAEELSGPEEELARYEHAFREHDSEGGELLDELAEYLEKHFVVGDQILRDPVAVALQCALGREDPEIMEKGRDR